MSNGEPKTGMSTGIKILIAFLICSGLCVVACCGGGFYFFRQAVNMTANPAEIQEMQKLIASIEIPAEYKPKSGVTSKVMGFNMNIVVYSRASGADDALIMMQMKLPGNVPEDQMEMSFENQLDAQQQGQSQDINVTETEPRSFMIDGEEVEFQFKTGTRSGTDQQVRQVTGVFPSRNGTTMLMFLEDEEHWDEEQVVKMIESISTQ